MNLLIPASVGPWVNYVSAEDSPGIVLGLLHEQRSRRVLSTTQGTFPSDPKGGHWHSERGARS